MPHVSPDKAFKGTLWFILSLTIGVVNDTITQYITMQGVAPLTIAFFRFLCSAALLLPFLLQQGKKSLTIHYASIHLYRGILTFGAIALWISGVSQSSVVTATLFNFTMPIISFILAPLFLQEGRNKYLSLSLIISFLGALYTLYPQTLTLNSYAIHFLLAILCFVTLDILTKKYIMKESMINLLFYANVIATLLSYPALHKTFTLPPIHTWAYLLLLAIGANLLLYTLLKAYQSTSLTTLAPLRYFEIVISLSLNYLCFHQIPTWHEAIGSLIIIPTSLFVVHLSLPRSDHNPQP